MSQRLNVRWKGLSAAFAIVASAVAVGVIDAGPAASLTGTLTLSSATSDVSGGYSNIPGHGWLTYGGCYTGRMPWNGGWRIFEWVVEFPLGDLPAGVTITSASLSLATSSPGSAGTTAVTGYAGDGTASSTDLTSTSTGSATFTPSPTNSESVDVTALLDSTVRTAGWVGFIVEMSPLDGNSQVGWDCPQDTDPPILTIEYSIADPTTTSVAVATATPTFTG